MFDETQPVPDVPSPQPDDTQANAHPDSADQTAPDVVENTAPNAPESPTDEAAGSTSTDTVETVETTPAEAEPQPALENTSDASAPAADQPLPDAAAETVATEEPADESAADNTASEPEVSEVADAQAAPDTSEAAPQESDAPAPVPASEPAAEQPTVETPAPDVDPLVVAQADIDRLNREVATLNETLARVLLEHTALQMALDAERARIAALPGWEQMAEQLRDFRLDNERLVARNLELEALVLAAAPAEGQ